MGSIDARKMHLLKTEDHEYSSSSFSSNRIENKPGNKHLHGVMGIFHPALSKGEKAPNNSLVIIQRRDGWIGVYTYNIAPTLTEDTTSSIAVSIELLHAFPTNSYHYCKAALDRWQDKDDIISRGRLKREASSSKTSLSIPITLVASPCDDTGSIAIYDYDVQYSVTPLRIFSPVPETSPSTSSSSTVLPNMNNRSNKGLCMSIILYREILIGGYENGSICFFDINTGKILNDTKVSENSILSLDITSDGKQGIVGTTGDDVVTFDVEWKLIQRQDDQAKFLKEKLALNENQEKNFDQLDQESKPNCQKTKTEVKQEKSLLSEIFSTKKPFNNSTDNHCNNSEKEIKGYLKKDQEKKTTISMNMKMHVKSIEIKNLITIQQKRTGTSYIKLRKDNRIFLAASWDHRVQVYDLKNKRHLVNLAYHKDSVYSCDFHEDTNFFAVGSKDGTVTLWDIYSGN